MTKKYDIISLNGFMYAVDKEAECPKDSIAIFPDTRNSKITNYNPPIKCKWNYAANGCYNLLVVASNDPSLGLPLLPAVGNQIFILNDLKKLAEDSFSKAQEEFPIIPNVDVRPFKLGFVKGYKAASSKQYTETQLLSFINNEDNHTEGELGNSCIDVNTLKNYLQSLKPTIIAVEVEMKEYAYEPIIGKFPNYEVNPNPRLYRLVVDENNYVKIKQWIWEN